MRTPSRSPPTLHCFRSARIPRFGGWHGLAAPRIAWISDNTTDNPIIDPADLPAAQRAVDELRTSGPGHSVALTVRFLTIDGGYEPVELSASLLDLESGQCALLVVLTVE
ncbi:MULTISPECIES: hypothetical protein [Nocardiaceae]|uniref:hypothetical protein n=1 Tax=Nocardiaceae TaxID=85025 RepID=UPI000522E582|nr:MULTISPECIES: hypothetical protein [Rhodococcus]